MTRITELNICPFRRVAFWVMWAPGFDEMEERLE